MRNREFVFTPKIEYELVAESRQKRDKLREANLQNLQIPFWWTRGESNPWPPQCECGALPIELRAQKIKMPQPGLEPPFNFVQGTVEGFFGN